MSEKSKTPPFNLTEEPVAGPVTSPFAGPVNAGTRKVIHFKDCELAFRWCPPGTFLMGSPETEEGRIDNENQVSVTLTKGFWMMETVVTKKLWKTVKRRRLDCDEAYGLGDHYPAFDVSWKMAVDFCKNITSKLNSIGLIPSDLHITLPTEAQWEYACRAGTKTAYCFGDDPDILKDYAWFRGNANGQTQPVGQKKPNAWGLYDMHGNVWEWTADAWIDHLTGGVDPHVAGKRGSVRQLRGGGCMFMAKDCRSAVRFGFDPALRLVYDGFRLALSSSR